MSLLLAAIRIHSQFSINLLSAKPEDISVIGTVNQVSKKQLKGQSSYIAPLYHKFGYNIVMWLPNYFALKFYKGMIGK